MSETDGAGTQVVDTPEADPSPATTALEKMSDSERSDWRKTGTIPEPKAAVPAPADAPKVAPSEAAPKEPAKADSEPAPQEPKRKGAEARKAELGAEIQELLRKRAALTQEVEKLETPKTVEAKPEKEQVEAKPTSEDKNPDGTPRFKTYEDFIEELSGWKARQYAIDALKVELAKHEEVRKQTEIQQQNKLIEGNWKSKVAAATKAHPDFVDVAFDKTFLDSVPKGSVADAFVLESEHGAEVLYYLAQHPDEFATIHPLNPIAQARALFKIEQQFSASPTEKVPAKKITSAPPPAAEVGGRGTAPEDESTAAVKDGNYARYRAAQNARDLAARKG